MELLFNSVMDYGYGIRKMTLALPNSQGFGLDCWNILKTSLNNNIKDKDFNYSWNTHRIIGDKITDNINTTYNYVHDELNMKGDDDDIKNENWHCYHFFLQLTRIPKNNIFSLIRFAQIAYNLGQLKVCIENNEYDIDSLKFLEVNKMFNLNSYIIHI